MEAISRNRRVGAVDFAKQAIRQEAKALIELADTLGDDFQHAIDRLASCTGTVVVTGMGKAGLVGQKISATLCSTGTRSLFLHPAEAIHGDLGRISRDDVMFVLSMSGETEEIVRLLPSLKQMASGIVSVTSQRVSTLGRQSDHVIELGKLVEAEVNGLAPSTSTTAMLAIGDALALTLSRQRGFGMQDFARFHPGGSLGRKLTKVQDVMRPLKACRLAQINQTVRDTVVTMNQSGRRTGAVMIVDETQQLVGIFTDSDLVRLIQVESDALTKPVSEIMTRDPHTIDYDSLMPVAVSILAENHISELPVVDDARRPVGLIDITDLIGWLPDEEVRKAKIAPRLIPFPPSATRDGP